MEPKMAKKTAAKAAPTKTSKTTPETGEAPRAFLVPTGAGSLVQADLDPSMGEVSDVRGAPYLVFYTDRTRGETADMIRSQLGGVAYGAILIRDGQRVVSLDGSKALLVAEYRFFGAYDWSDGGRAVKVSATEEDGLEETFLALTLHLTKAGPELALSRVMKSQCGMVRDLVRGVRDAGTPGFLQRVAAGSKPLAQAMGGVPARYRVYGHAVGQMKTGASGYSYLRATARVRPVDAETWAALAAVFEDAEFQVRLEDLLQTFTARKAEVEAAL
jgi:hypothetical protein